MALMCCRPDFDVLTFKWFLYVWEWIQIFEICHDFLSLICNTIYASLSYSCLHIVITTVIIYNLLTCELLHQLQQYIAFKIENDLIQIEAAPCMVDDMLSIESLKVEVACLYYLQLPVDKRSRGRQFLPNFKFSKLHITNHQNIGMRYMLNQLD